MFRLAKGGGFHDLAGLSREFPWRVNPGKTTLIEIRPHPWSWKVFESPGVESVDSKWMAPGYGKPLATAACRSYPWAGLSGDSRESIPRQS
jgi:hypothetical protein